MKKLLLIVFCLISVIGFSQTKITNVDLVDLMSKELVEKTERSIIEKKLNEDDVYSVGIELHRFYDFELVTMSVKSVFDSYSNFSVIDPWTKNDGSYYKTFRVTFKDSPMLIIRVAYFTTNNTLYLLCK